MRLAKAGRAACLGSTPITRLTVLTLIGAGAFLALGLVVMQGPQGWSWSPPDWRSLTEVDPGVWSSMATGLIAYLLSVWVWALKPSNPAASLFAISGVATLIFCFSSFSPSLALPLSPEVRAGFWVTNMLGASAFGMIMISLFLIYPTPLPRWRWLMAASLLGFGVWTLLRTFGPWRDFAEVQLITTVEMIGIILVTVWQMRACAGEPRKHAVAVWLGASVLLGAGAFIATVAAPLSFGFQPLVRENYAFAFFLTIYVGLAVGLMRYRLFDLGAWSYRILFYTAGLLLIVSMLTLGRALEHSGALGLIVDGVAPLLAQTRPIVALFVVYALTSILTETVTNNAVAVLMAPIAASVALQLGLDPRPFVVAVMFAASASFATPIGYQTNTLVSSAGGYRFMDFVRIGAPMNLLTGAVTVFVIPMIWPLA